MSLGHRELVQACVEVLDTYDPDCKALEEHVETYFEAKQIEDDSDQTFIMEVFSGCVRYSRVIKVVMDGFFVRDGKNVLRSEEHLFRVFCYIALFRLDELGMAHFHRFVRTQDVNKMYKFLTFFVDEKNLRTWMKDEWIKLYESSFVHTTLLSPLLRWLPELKEMIKGLKDKIDNKVKLKRPVIITTEPKPFNITQPRPRSVPMPEPKRIDPLDRQYTCIPKLQKHQPAPKSTWMPPKEVDVLAKVREQNRRKAEEHLMEASRSQFSCANPDKSEKTRMRLRRIMDEEQQKLDFNKHKSHPLPNTILADNVPIKLNAAAILREGHLYQQRETEELKKLERLEAGARDPSGFLEWQNKMRQADLEEKLGDIERRRLEGKLSHEDAILARQDMIKDNRQKVQQWKKEAQEMMNEYMRRRLEEEQEMRNLVAVVAEGHENAKEAKKNLQEYKAKIVQEVNEESKELMKQALEEAEAEMRKKMELIQQIRAMEATPVVRHKFVDLTEKAGHGLLSEMSIAELNERLSLLKIAEFEDEEAKRDDILAGKQAKDEKLLETLETISRHRKEQTKVAAIKARHSERLEQRKKTHVEKPVVKDEKLSELQRKLEEKRSLRLREQQASKISPDKKSSHRLRQLSANKKTGEAKRWEELEQTRERTARLVSQGVKSSEQASRLTANRTLLTMY